MDTRTSFSNARRVALGLALLAAGCTSDTPDRASDASSVEPTCDGHTGRCDGSAGDSQVDAGPDCTDVVHTPQGAIVRDCIYSIPPGATLDWSSPLAEIRVSSPDGGLLATYDHCACLSSMGFELIPTGADPNTWQLADAGIHASDYDRSCQNDADCVSVVDGDLNFPCFCPTAAIASSAAADYQADLIHKRQGGVFGGICGCPAYGNPVCREGQCTTSFAMVTTRDGGTGTDAGAPAAADASAGDASR